MKVPGGARAVDNLLRWADSGEWESRRRLVFDAHFGMLLEDLDMSAEELFEGLGNHGETILQFIIEDFLAAWFGDDEDENVVDEYLKRRGWLEKRPATQYLRGLRDAAPSLYEVQGLDPGRSLTVRDLLRGGDPVRVDERLGSESLAQWDCMVARIVRVGRSRCFTAAVLHFPRELAEDCARKFGLLAKDLRKRFRAAAKKEGRSEEITDDGLRDFLLESPHVAPFFTVCFVSWTLDRLAAPLPEMHNTDGETLVLSTVRFPIAGTEAEVVAALDGLEAFDRPADGGWAWAWLGRPRRAAERRKKTDPAGPDDPPASLKLGDAEIADGALFLRVNSVERAERGRDLLASRLGPLLGTPLTSHEDPGELLRKEPSEPPAEAEETDPPPGMVEAVQAYLEDHYRRVLDEPIPMLGNRSPRRAAKTKKGRVAVIEWLKGLENHESRSAIEQGRPPLDTAWLWDELKIPRPGDNG